MRIPVGEATETDPFEPELRPSPGLGFRNPAELEPHAHVVESRLPREQGFLLEKITGTLVDAREGDAFDPHPSRRG